MADCAYNTQETIAAMQQAAQDGAALAVFPELGLTGYTCSDLFLQQPLLDAAEQGLRDILRASETLELVAVVGLPVRVDGALYNCAAVVCHGALLGLVPKTHLPNYAEFYELRHFTPAPAETRSVTLCGASVPFGTDLLFRCREMPDFCLGVEICEDLWARCRRAPAMRWPGQRCLPISRQVTKPSARRNTAASSSASNPHAC